LPDFSPFAGLLANLETSDPPARADGGGSPHLYGRRQALLLSAARCDFTIRLATYGQY